MVKVIIQTEDETIVKEGDFFFGSVISSKTDGYKANDIASGNVNVIDIPQIVARSIVNLVKKASGPDVIRQIGALYGLSDRIRKAIDKEVTDNMIPILSSMKDAIDKLGR